ncbi:MAG TPA: hypothetical protein VKD71_04575 [Gemmataceae bacterium]|nr:hypothetical protein [Gemmataceae bacterium]
MRILSTIVILAGLFGQAVCAQDSRAAFDKQASEALRDVHDRGAELYNAGDAAAGYRMYQGGLIVVRGLLGHRPEVQKLIADGLSEAERQASVARRAFVLHELIEKVRVELRGRKTGESITVPPREIKPGKKPELKPAGAVGEVKEGVIGRVLWQGKPIAGVDVLFVTLGRLQPKVYETTTGAQGVYTVAEITPGRYVVLITAGPNAEVKKLPERYATATTSPLVIEVKGGGEKLDFVLQ